MPRKHDYSAPKDYGLHIDDVLEKANAKVIANSWKQTPRIPSESALEHLRRVNIKFRKNEKKRNAYGRLI